MPISSYPRYGCLIAPSLLEPFLRAKVRTIGVQFCELDEKTWDRFSHSTCRQLAKHLVQHLAPKLGDIRSSLGSISVSPVKTHISFSDLQLEFRTFNCLNTIHWDGASDAIASLTIGEVLDIRAFGVKSLVDLLTSVESATARMAVDGNATTSSHATRSREQKKQ